MRKYAHRAASDMGAGASKQLANLRAVALDRYVPSNLDELYSHEQGVAEAR